MNNKTNMIISSLLLLFFIAYIISLALRFYKQDYKTELPYVFEVANEYATQGIIIRDEKEYVKNYNGSLSYIVDDGTKVLPTTVVAKEYSNDEYLLIDKEIDKVKEVYKEIQNLEQREKQVIKDISSLNQDIIESMKPFMLLKDKNSTDDLIKIETNMASSILNSKIAVGNKVDFSEVKTELAHFIQQNIEYNTHTADFRGIFTSYVDGYEDILKPEILKDIGFEKYHELMNAEYPQKENSFGKNINNINWYYVTEVPYYISRLFMSTKKLNMTFSSDKSKVITGRVVNTINDAENENSIVIIRSNDIIPQAVGNRKVSINIGFQDFSGIRFSDKALRIIDGQQGVYVVGKVSVEFKKVDIIYRGPDFYLSKINYTDNDYLNIFNEIIVKGNNMYDGKELK